MTPQASAAVSSNQALTSSKPQDPGRLGDDLKRLYQSVILTHCKDTTNRGTPDLPYVSGEGRNAMCGDQITVHLVLSDDGHNRIDQAMFEGRGCAMCLASASVLTQVAVGHTLNEMTEISGYLSALCHGEHASAPMSLSALHHGELKALSGVRLFPARIRCVQLAWDAAQEALASAVDQSITAAAGDQIP
jgi:nitrogen fixation NifU-like protein